jgi:eukaryotic-like serine/threonine-protein kinase
MALSAGDQLGPFEIIAPIGAGGMGQVYRARDTRLNRDVAIKVLPTALADNAQYMARFEREAQTLAAMNHPNIATVYGVEQGALVMELVEGADLQGPLPVDDVIPIARQIAEGLESAHERGIIHRDLKPANVKVTPAGVVKILDFGLAKTTGEFGAAAASANRTLSPTLSLSMTEAGVILGTAAYMSPEQARGKPVDKRADIWAFGVVIYELLTGTRLFGGETLTDTIAAVMTVEPNWNALPAETPPRVRRLLERCLQRDPRQRLRDIGEARVLLGEPEAMAPDTSASRAGREWLVAAIVAAFLAGCALAAAMVWVRSKPTASNPGVARFLVSLPPGTVLPTNGNLSTQWMPSPDGRNLAMIAEDSALGKTALWIRPLGATSAHRLDGTEDAIFPFWSPDGQHIGFFADGRLKHVALSGGNVQTVCTHSAGSGGAWGQDDVILFGRSGGPLLQIASTGGVPQPATVLAKGETGHSSPQFLPGGRHVLYLAEHKDPADNAIYVQELGSAKRVRVLNTMTRAMWSPPGQLLFVREGTLFAQRMDLKTFQVHGEAQAVAQDVAANDTQGRSTFAVSSNGVLAYRSGAPVETRQLTWRDRDGKVLGTVGGPGKILNPSLSPDGKSVAVTMGDVEMNAWVINLASGVPIRLTSDATAPLFYRAVLWSRNSERLAVSHARLGIEEIAVASGQILSQSKEPMVAEDWMPDGAGLLCSDGRQLFVLNPADLTKRQIIPGAQGKMHRFSPDGQFVVYVVDEAGVSEIYVSPFPSFAVKRKVSSVPGFFPLWAKSGKEIVYRSTEGWMMSIGVDTGGGIEASVPKPLFQFGSGSMLVNRFAVSADGNRFLTSEPVNDGNAEKPAITLVINWAADLKLP